MESFKDIVFFMFFLIIILIAFMVGLLIVDTNFLRQQISLHTGSEEFELDSSILERTGLKAIDALFEQWLMGLGEFETLGNADELDAYNSIKLLLWIYFMAGTLITQIIVFNILIAILGDTYERIMDSRI